MEEFKILIIDLIDRDESIAEVYYQKECLGWVLSLDGKFKIEFFARKESITWILPYEKMMTTFEKAYEMLLVRQEKYQLRFLNQIENGVDVNNLAQNVLQEIILHPDRKVFSNRFGGSDIYEPSGRGVRVNKQQEFLGFLEVRYHDEM